MSYFAALPTPPTSSDPASFSSRGDEFLAALQVLSKNVDRLVNNSLHWTTVNSALNAALVCAIWVSGYTAAVGDRRYSPIDGQIYRALSAGVSSTDPALDRTQWQLMTFGLVPLITTLDREVAGLAGTHAVLRSEGACVYTLPATPVVGQWLWVTFTNTLESNRIACNGKPIMGASEDMVVNVAQSTVGLRYVDSTWGWRVTT